MKKHVLIVDNETHVGAHSREFFDDFDITVDIAETADEALTLMDMREYALIIVGLKPVEPYGQKEQELFMAIKENKETTGIILVTDCCSFKSMEEAFSIGASYFREKRLSARVLKNAMNNYSENSI